MDGHLFDPGPSTVVRGPWVTLCGDPGPYAIRRPTPKAPYRLQVLTCTRPTHHDDELHSYADYDGRVLATWHRDGTPRYPPVIRSTVSTRPDRRI